MTTNEILKGVSITLSNEVSEELFFTALCDALGYMQGYGLELDYSKEDYEKAKNNLKEKGIGSISFEDVLMQILRDGNKLTFIDNECDGEYTSSITLKDVHNRVKNMPITNLVDMINQNGDAITSDVLLQTVFFNNVIFG